MEWIPCFTKQFSFKNLSSNRSLRVQIYPSRGHSPGPTHLLRLTPPQPKQHLVAAASSGQQPASLIASSSSSNSQAVVVVLAPTELCILTWFASPYYFNYHGHAANTVDAGPLAASLDADMLRRKLRSSRTDSDESVALVQTPTHNDIMIPISINELVNNELPGIESDGDKPSTTYNYIYQPEP